MDEAGGSTAGLVLAAGAGSRYGSPKGLATAEDGTPWVRIAGELLREAGCGPVMVAVGAAAAEVESLMPAGAVPVPVPDWRSGLSASVAAGLRAAEASGAEALLIVPVDTPGMPAEAVRRLRALASPDALAQAVYEGRPGHPVLVGHTHWAALAADLSGDRGAGPYLRVHGAARVECGDLWDGADVDRPSDG